ncbi:hypothetical protein LLEC1_05623, partial [Akanthomyces lecanii]
MRSLSPIRYTMALPRTAVVAHGSRLGHPQSQSHGDFGPQTGVGEILSPSPDQAESWNYALNDDTVHMVIHRSDYHKVLWDTAKELGVEPSLGAEVVKVDYDKTEVTLASSETLSVDIVIGADGLWSVARDSILQCPSPPTETRDLAYRVTVSIEQIEALDDASVTELCSQSGVTTWMGPQCHCVFYPVRDNTEFNIVLLVPDTLEHGVSRAEGDFAEMMAAFEDWDDRLVKMLSQVTSVEKWKLCHHAELESWKKNAVALLGDAFHPTLPYQVQGAAMAVEDGAVLGRLLGLLKTSTKDTSTMQERIPGLLKLYESLRKRRTTASVLGAVANRKWFHLADGPLQEARDGAMAASCSEVTEQESWSFLSDEYQAEMLGFDAVEDCELAFHRWFSEAYG